MANIHDELTQAPIHVNYRLWGSVPKSKLEQLVFQRDQQLSMLEQRISGLPDHLKKEQWSKNSFSIHGNFELSVEKALHDMKISGPRYLNRPEIARIVLESWANMQERRLVFIYAVCVMSNHVHIIMRVADGVESESLSALMRKHKGFTARMIIRVLDRTGQAFWEPKFFDRRVRTGKFNTIMWYVLNNPVAAGLVKNWREWPYTYLHPEFGSLFGNK